MDTAQLIIAFHNFANAPKYGDGILLKTENGNIVLKLGFVICQVTSHII
jgi:hypothetical protein